MIAVLCAAATLCNPFGIGVLLDSLQAAHSGMFARIDEWKPPLPEPQLAPMIWCEIALIVMATIGWWRNPQRRLAHGAWLLLFFAMFLMQRRHLWILALVCLAVGAGNARFLDLSVAWKFCLRLLKQPAIVPSPLLRLAWRATLLFGLACAAGATLESQHGNLFPLRGVNSVPAGAARFVNEKKLRGRVFNDYENSSYFQWAWNGKHPLRPRENARHLPSEARRALYIDLLNAYPPALLEEYLAIWKGGATAQKLLDQRDVKIIILGDDKRDRDFTKWLNANPKWRRIYDRRGDGMVWIRAAKNAASLKKE